MEIILVPFTVALLDYSTVKFSFSVTLLCHFTVSIIMSFTLVELSRQKRAKLRHMTNANDHLLELCREDFDRVSLNDAIDEFDKHLSELDHIQQELELKLEEKELDVQIGEFIDLRNNFKKTRVNATKFMNSQPTIVKQSSNPGSTNSNFSANNAKLPKIVLPTFNGDLKNWLPFWDQFKVLIHESDSPPVTKFTYLISVLKNEAKASVQNLALTEANYDIAVSLLKDRYGRKEAIISSHIDTLLRITIPNSLETSELWEVLDIISSNIRALENLGISGAQYGVLLTPIILSRMPEELRLEWARDTGHESDLQYLLDFFKKEISRRERSKPMISTQDQRPGTATTLLAETKSAPKKFCVICKKTNHVIEKCFNLTKLTSPQEKQDLLKSHKVCFKCLSSDPKHQFRKCNVTCRKCKSYHHILLCDKDKQMKSPANVSVSTAAQTDFEIHNTNVKTQTQIRDNSTMVSSSFDKNQVLLQVAKVRVKGSKGVSEAIVMFDTGADRSYISEELVKKTAPTWLCTQEVSCATFGSRTTGNVEKRNVYSLDLLGTDSKTSVQVTEIRHICASLSRPSIDESIVSSFGEELNIVKARSGEVKVDILIGLDCYWRLVTGAIKTISEGLVAQNTLFGWVISGKLVDTQASVTQVVSSTQLLCLDVNESLANKFWNLESIGISPTEVPEKSDALQKFEKSTSFENGRYEVHLPWKSGGRSKLLSNFNQANARLERLKQKLELTPDLKMTYHQIIQGMNERGIIAEVNESDLSVSEPVYYMPHRPVLKPDSLTTKVRPVFDASAKCPNGISLNDCIETGPNLVPDLPGVLLRFRRWKYAISADISKAFHMVGMNSHDQNVHRFLWDDLGKTRVMKFTRVPFGNKSSMFLLLATIRHHLSKYPYSHVINELRDNMYIDNWLSGSDEITISCNMTKEAKAVMSQAGMILTQWASNSDKVGKSVTQDLGETYIENDCLKVLGLRWVSSEDVFEYECSHFPFDICLTKKVMLGYISRLFDPLGFALPFIMSARIMFQNVWNLKIDWDETIPQSVDKNFQKWIKGLACLRSWNIPRKLTVFDWKDIKVLEIHVFGDASPQAYGACAYLRAQSQRGQWNLSLAFARARVAPLKQITLPRLELLAALLCARLAVFVQKELRIADQASVHCWTDSTVTLAWIKSNPDRWKVFVKNRVSDIHSSVPPQSWYHCSGQDNPSDLLTRGLSAQELTCSEFWLRGPLFLRNSTEVWPKGDPVSLAKALDSEVAKEEKKSSNQPVLLSAQMSQKVFPLERWSKFTKAIRVVAYVLRFVNNLRKRSEYRNSPELSFSELCKAKQALILDCQKNSFANEYISLSQQQSLLKGSPLFKLTPCIGSDGLIRIKGRLQMSNLHAEEQSPIIIPKSHLGLLLARHIHQSNKHAGVNSMLVFLRDQFWVIGARVVCKKVKRECVSCQRQDSKAFFNTRAPLPEVRARPAAPFSITGLDHGGPLYCCDMPGDKFYILLFTCAVTRALHLELVNSLSGETSFLAIRRFMARRGIPSVIMSDNAKGFESAEKKLVAIFGTDGPRWRPIAPLSPWWGGWWERLIGSVKQALRKSIGKRNLTYAELETCLLEVEMVLNSRPLTFVGDNLEDGEILTPSHFLIGRKVMSKSSLDHQSFKHEDLVGRWEVQNEALDEFLSFWNTVYLRNLPPFKGPVTQRPIETGEVVLIRDEGYPRLQWPIGLVQKVFPGVDQHTRAVELKTKKGILVRPIQKLHCLEVVPIQNALPQIIQRDYNVQMPEVNHVHTETDTSQPLEKSRSGRTLKKVQDPNFLY